MSLQNSADKPETDEVTVVITVVEGAVDEIRAFGDRRRAEEVRERIEADEPWKTWSWRPSACPLTSRTCARITSRGCVRSKRPSTPRDDRCRGVTPD